MVFNVKVNEFDGPIDLLLSNVVSGKLEVNSISLVSLVMEFIEVIESSGNSKLDGLSRFISVMSMLLHYKCRGILGKTFEDDIDLEEISSAEEREVLLIALLGVAVFKDVSFELQRRIEQTSMTISRDVGPDLDLVSDVSDPLRKVSPQELRSVFERMVSKVERDVVDATHITTTQISVREVGERVMERIVASKRVTFSELIRFAKSRFEIVVSFLIILEGARAGVLELEMAEVEENDSVLIRLSTALSDSLYENFTDLIRALD